jgi:hypothetical protein
VFMCEPRGVYATAYERPSEGLLMFVSNLEDHPVDAMIKLNRDQFGWKGAPKAWNAISKEPFAITDGVMRFQMDAWQYRVVRVLGPDDKPLLKNK